jgi:hypothetical protein
VGVTGDISIVGILVDRGIHPVSDTEKETEDDDYGADDEKTAGRTVPGFAFLIGVVFLIPVTLRRSSGDVVERKGVFLD